MMKKRYAYVAIFLLSFLLIGVQAAFAQDFPVVHDEEPQIPPAEPQMLGMLEGNGTHFELNNSEYLNITLDSSEPVHLILESVPEMVVMHLEATSPATSTVITLSGFPPSTTYYEYEDDYHNLVTFTTDEKGNYSYVQDLSNPHLVFIQPRASTKFIPSDTLIGTWDTVTRTYTLTTDVHETIQIDEDNLILDGNGHTVTGTGTGFGVLLNGRTGVTIKNLNVTQFSYGINLLSDSSGNTLTGNSASNTYYGIYLYFSSNNNLTNNTASNNYDGIRLVSSSNNTLTNNTASNNVYGIYLRTYPWYSCNNNTLTNNTANSNYYHGIRLDYSSNNTLTNNTANSNNQYGIYLYSSSNNTLTNNTANSNNGCGIYLYFYSHFNTLTNNTANSNYYHGIRLDYSSNNTLTNNTANSNNWYGIYLYRSSNNNLTNNTANSNYYHGIYMMRSNYNTLTNNTANSNNQYGIYLRSSSNNTLTNNTASNNNWYGITLQNSGNNLIYNNYFNNTMNAWDNGNNIWNITKTAGLNIISGPYLGGNYWSDYSGEDTNEDGIGNTQLPYNSSGDIVEGGDWLPLTPTNVSVETSTGTGTAAFSTDSGQFAGITGVAEDSLPQEARDNKPKGLMLPHGLFNFTITGLTPGQSVTVTITLPSPVPMGSLWWKVNTTAENNTWYSLPIGSDNGDNVVTITLTDGGPGDNDGVVNGIIVDPSGIGIPSAPPNLLPVANANGPYTGYEGSPITFDGTASYDSDGTIVSYEWDFEYDGVTFNTDSIEQKPSYTWFDDYAGTVALRVTDDDDAVSPIYTTTVTVRNVDPTVVSIDAPLEPVQVDTTVTVRATFTDPGSGDTQTAEWDWGDEFTPTGGTFEGYTIIGSHKYTTPGVYTIKLTVTDDDGGSGEAVTEEYVVVYDPIGGFVTGGGWIDSPPGAHVANPNDLGGKANFGFVSKYKKGQQTPTGNTEFQFKAGNLNFHSDSYEWLVIAGHKAMYKGNGTINGDGNFGFMLSAIDEKLTPSTDVDMFRIKIWDKDKGDVVVYDNQMSAADDADPTTAIAGGQVVIHKAK